MVWTHTKDAIKSRENKAGVVTLTSVNVCPSTPVIFWRITRKMENKIKGGYYIKARCIQQSEISIAPPHVREIWDWLLLKANWGETKKNGITLERGQILTSYKEIREGLSWKIGYRKAKYSKNNCETAMRWLTKRHMVRTTKHTGGLLVEIVKYNYFQDPNNYETYNEHTMNIQSTYNESTPLLKKKKKNKKNKKNNIYIEQAKRVIDYLNEKTNSKFKYIESNMKFIIGRLKENYIHEDFVKVIDIKLKDPYFQENPKYLNPTTLFRPSNFDKYLNEKETNQSKESEDLDAELRAAGKLLESEEDCEKWLKKIKGCGNDL